MWHRDVHSHPWELIWLSQIVIVIITITTIITNTITFIITSTTSTTIASFNKQLRATLLLELPSRYPQSRAWWEEAV